MTRPVEIKRDEAAGEGSRFGDFVAGMPLGPVTFELVPGFIEEYMACMRSEPSMYRLGGEGVAPTQLLLLYLMAVLHHRYAPPHGIVMTELKMRLRQPIRRDVSTAVVATGRILETFERRRRCFVRWEAAFDRSDGVRLLEVENVFMLES